MDNNETRLNADTLQAARNDYEEAEAEVIALTAGRRHWRTSIPVQARDSDMILLRALDRIPELLAYVETLEGELKSRGGYEAFVASCARSGETPHDYAEYVVRMAETRRERNEDRGS